MPFITMNIESLMYEYCKNHIYEPKAILMHPNMYKLFKNEVDILITTPETKCKLRSSRSIKTYKGIEILRTEDLREEEIRIL